MANDIDDLVDAAGQPLEMETDAARIKMQSLKDRIELLKLAQAQEAATSARSSGRAVGWAAVSAGRVVPPGSI